MDSKSRWPDINKAGSGCKPTSSDEPLNEDTQTAIDNAERASRSHQQVNELADRSGK